MFGDLFGDLPATKNDSDANRIVNKKQVEKEKKKTATTNDEDRTKDFSTGTQTTEDYSEEKPSSNKHLDHVDDDKNRKKQQSSSSIVRNLGVAGTSMAFVPTAARRRKIATQQNLHNPLHHLEGPTKKQRSVEQSSSLPSLTDAAPPGTDSSSNVTSMDKLEQINVSKPSTILTIDSNNVKRDDQDDTPNHPSCPQPTTAKSHDTDTTSCRRYSNDSTDSKIHSNNINHDQIVELTENESDKNEYPTTKSSSPCSKQQFNQDEQSTVLHILNEKVRADPYDPFFPNDLLHYWEYTNSIRQKYELERERVDAIHAQELIREKLKQEREELARLVVEAKTEAEAITVAGRTLQQNTPGQVSGTCTMISTAPEHTAMVELSSSGIGRGRGGLSNLPAWVVKKLKQEDKTIV